MFNNPKCRKLHTFYLAQWSRQSLEINKTGEIRNKIEDSNSCNIFYSSSGRHEAVIVPYGINFIVIIIAIAIKSLSAENPLRALTSDPPPCHHRYPHFQPQLKQHFGGLFCCSCDEKLMYKGDFILIEFYKIEPGVKNKSNQAVGKLMLIELKILKSISSDILYDLKYVKSFTFVAVYPFC